jgi:hypothetical protein
LSTTELDYGLNTSEKNIAWAPCKEYGLRTSEKDYGSSTLEKVYGLSTLKG